MITSNIIIAISVINIIIASIVIYKQRKTITVKKKNPFLIDIWFIAINFALSASASICTVTLSLKFAQNKFENPWVASLMLITMQVAYISIKYFDAFDKDIKPINDKAHKLKIEGDNLKAVLTSWFKHKLSGHKKVRRKINWAVLLFWSMFVVLTIPASLENSEKFINLKKEKLVKENITITITDYKPELDEINATIDDYDIEVKKLEKITEPTELQLGRLSWYKWQIKVKRDRKSEIFVEQKNQNDKITEQNKIKAENKLKEEENKIDFIFDTIGIIWSFVFGILLELGAAYFTTKGSKRLFELRKKMDRHKTNEEKKSIKKDKSHPNITIEEVLIEKPVETKPVEEPEDIEISDETIKGLREFVQEVKNDRENFEPNDVSLITEDLIKDSTEQPEITEEQISPEDLLIDIVEPDLINSEDLDKLKKHSAIKDLGEFEFSDDWEFLDELGKNYNLEDWKSVDKKEIPSYNDYNKMIEENDRSKIVNEPVIEKEQPVFEYKPAPNKKVSKERRISIDELLEDKDELYPQRNLNFKKRD